MKNFFALLLITLLLAIPAEAKKNKNKDNGNAVISFVTQTHDFGIIPADKKFVSTEFEFVNVGNAPLVIKSAKADCGCTRPDYPKNPIAPGKKGKIKVNFIPTGYKGSFTKNIKVKSNGSNKIKVLKITGIVNPNK